MVMAIVLIMVMVVVIVVVLMTCVAYTALSAQAVSVPDSHHNSYSPNVTQSVTFMLIRCNYSSNVAEVCLYLTLAILTAQNVGLKTLTVPRVEGGVGSTRFVGDKTRGQEGEEKG
jgi:flagellar basal body-associated protein FliL